MATSEKIDFSEYQHPGENDIQHLQKENFNTPDHKHQNRNDFNRGSGSGSGSGSGANLSARVQACVGKKYGEYCSWRANDGSNQSGKCVYDKWGWTPGPLFCAKADYKDSESPENQTGEE